MGYIFGRYGIEPMRVIHIRRQVRTWLLNANVERLFRDDKAWEKRAWLQLGIDGIQHRLNAYRKWHSRFRPHSAQVH